MGWNRSGRSGGLRVRPIDRNAMGLRVSARRIGVARREGAVRDPARLIRERKVWGDRFGADWVPALRQFALWALETGIPVQSGSAELLCSVLARSWGWGSAPVELVPEVEGAPAVPGPGAWVLRVPPGFASRVRDRLSGDPVLAGAGKAPWIQLEETALVHLPADLGPAERWPSAEGWLRGNRLARMQTRVPDLMAPEGPGELVKRLRDSMPSDEAVMAAWDVWRAGVAWERERASYWLVRHAAGFANPDSERAWRRRATDWGVRVFEPTTTQREPCARIESGGVRLGLDALPPRRRRRWRNPALGWMELARAILHGVAHANLPVRTQRSKSFRFT